MTMSNTALSTWLHEGRMMLHGPANPQARAVPVECRRRLKAKSYLCACHQHSAGDMIQCHLN